MEDILIEKVRERKELYNTRSANYRDHNIRQQAWEEIAKELQTTATSVKNSWEKLRRCFLNALSRRRMKKSSDATKKITPWKYEGRMAFLLPYLQGRNTETISSNVNSPEEVETEQERNVSQENVSIDKEKGQVIRKTDRKTIDDIIKNENVLNIDSETASRIQRKRKRATLDDCLKSSGHCIKRKCQPTRNKFEKIKKLANITSLDSFMDETDMFFMSMSKTTKTLPTVEQAKIKKMLGNVVLDAQIKMSQNKHRQTDFYYSSAHSEAPAYSGYSSA